MRDTSLVGCRRASRAPIVEVRVFNRHGVGQKERAMAIEREETRRLVKDRDDELQILDRTRHARLKDALLGKEVAKDPKAAPKGTNIDEAILDAYPAQSVVGRFGLASEKAQAELEAIQKQYEDAKKGLGLRFADKVDN